MKIDVNGIKIETERHLEEENRFNVIYKDLSDHDQKLIRDMKGTAAILATLIGQNINRESSIAMTNLETAIMWAVKGVCVGHENA